jgi:tetratricopeptide (TPR) repeat protein
MRLKQIEQEQREKEELERIEQFKREENARNEFMLRKAKYQVSSFKNNSPLSELNLILMKLDDNDSISDQDEQWLKSNRLFPVLAIHYERISNLAAAGSNWRKSDNPRRALEITQNIQSPNQYILTMRGGAFRDINDYEQAKECAFSALQQAPNDHHPYNLLGAIFYQQGLPEEGYKYFQKANSLGSKPIEEDTSIKSALSKAGSDEKKLVAEFLLAKDPKRYEWTKFYLK